MTLVVYPGVSGLCGACVVAVWAAGMGHACPQSGKEGKLQVHADNTAKKNENKAPAPLQRPGAATYLDKIRRPIQDWCAWNGVSRG